jgi:hypothetical protein
VIFQAHQQQVKTLVELIYQEITSNLPDIEIAAGIGGSSIGISLLNKSYAEAQKAILLGRTVNRVPISSHSIVNLTPITAVHAAAQGGVDDFMHLHFNAVRIPAPERQLTDPYTESVFCAWPQHPNNFRSDVSAPQYGGQQTDQGAYYGLQPDNPEDCFTLELCLKLHGLQELHAG